MSADLELPKAAWNAVAGDPREPDEHALLRALGGRRRRRERRIRVAASSVLLVMVVAVAAVVAVTTGGSDAAAVELRRAARSVTDRGSARTSFDIEAAGGFGFAQIRGSGLISFTDRTAHFDLDTELLSDDAELIIVAETVYVRTSRLASVTLPESLWITVPGGTGVFDVSPSEALDVLEAIRDDENIEVRKGPSVDVGGIRTDEYTFSATNAKGNRLSGKAFVDESRMLRRVDLDGFEERGAVDLNVEARIDFSDFGVEVHVEPPPPESVTTVEELLQP